MNYELTKELKEAGFPQEGGGTFSKYRKDIDGKNVEVVNVYIFTLSELIKACGKPLALQIDDDKCEAQSYGDRPRITETGSTPEEAVARLWLALQK